MRQTKEQRQRAEELRRQMGKELKQQASFELARRDFWHFCKLMAPDFYRDDRPHLKDLCRALQDFYQSDRKILIVNMPPRHGKSYTAQHFVCWCLGQNPQEKVMTASYNEKVSTDFSQNARDTIGAVHGDDATIVYTDIFPGTVLKRGSAAKRMWAVNKNYSSYLATSPNGTATGYGCSLMLIDDLIQNSFDANNARVLEDHFRWYTGTMLSRLEQGGKIIVIATRWCTGDLSGRLLDFYKDEPERLQVVTAKALVDEKSHQMLCPSILSFEDYQAMLDVAADKSIILANYQQVATDKQNALYTGFRTYAPAAVEEGAEVYAYCDVADTGKDYLCNIVFSVDRAAGACRVLDVYYTQERAEVTEPELAKRLKAFKVVTARIEANNGGRGFARNVQRLLEAELHHYTTTIKAFHQSKNKEARINTHAANAQKYVEFPERWQVLWPDFYAAIAGTQRTVAAMLHDDAPDALTGVVETFLKLMGWG